MRFSSFAQFFLYFLVVVHSPFPKNNLIHFSQSYGVSDFHISAALGYPGARTTFSPFKWKLFEIIT